MVSFSKILSRINPLYEGTREEIEKVIHYGTDIIMLPMFRSADDVRTFVDLVGGRVTTCLLLETAQAMVRIDDILEVVGIDEIHIGLNDLHLSLGLDFMFEPLSCGVVEYLGNKIQNKGIRWGFGGIAQIGEGMVPAEYIIGEHIRLGSEMVILSRAFRNKEDISFVGPVNKIRNKIDETKRWNAAEFEENREAIQMAVRKTVLEMSAKKSEILI